MYWNTWVQCHKYIVSTEMYWEAQFLHDIIVLLGLNEVLYHGAFCP